LSARLSNSAVDELEQFDTEWKAAIEKYKDDHQQALCDGRQKAVRLVINRFQDCSAKISI